MIPRAQGPRPPPSAVDGGSFSKIRSAARPEKVALSNAGLAGPVPRRSPPLQCLVLSVLSRWTKALHRARTNSDYPEF